MDTGPLLSLSDPIQVMIWWGFPWNMNPAYTNACDNFRWFKLLPKFNSTQLYLIYGLDQTIRSCYVLVWTWSFILNMTWSWHGGYIFPARPNYINNFIVIIVKSLLKTFSECLRTQTWSLQPVFTCKNRGHDSIIILMVSCEGLVWGN